MLMKVKWLPGTEMGQLILVPVALAVGLAGTNCGGNHRWRELGHP